MRDVLALGRAAGAVFRLVGRYRYASVVGALVTLGYVGVHFAGRASASVAGSARGVGSGFGPGPSGPIVSDGAARDLGAFLTWLGDADTFGPTLVTIGWFGFAGALGACAVLLVCGVPGRTGGVHSRGGAVAGAVGGPRDGRRDLVSVSHVADGDRLGQAVRLP